MLFVLQPHFSLLAFTAAADTLVTANLVGGRTRYRVATLASGPAPLASDIGIALAPGADLDTPHAAALDGVDHVLVCGGYRCSLDEEPRLTALLREAAARELVLGGLWNGVAALAHARLLGGHDCALHPRDRAAFAARFPAVRVRRRAVVVDRGRVSAAGPASALELMLALVRRRDGATTARAVRAILRADAGSGGEGEAAFAEEEERTLPHALSTALELMRNNLDEPLSREELARHAGLSTRSLERLFRERLDGSPARHYAELRLRRAAELLHERPRPIAEVARATGFATPAAFSRAFTRRFGVAPRVHRAIAGSGGRWRDL